MAWDGPVSLLLLVTLCRLLVLVLLLRLLVLNVVNPPILLVAWVISRVTGSPVALVPPIVWELVLIGARWPLPIILLVEGVVPLLLLALISLEISRTIVALLVSRWTACLFLPCGVIITLVLLCVLLLLA